MKDKSHVISEDNDMEIIAQSKTLAINTNKNVNPQLAEENKIINKIQSNVILVTKKRASLNEIKVRYAKAANDSMCRLDKSIINTIISHNFLIAKKQLVNSVDFDNNDGNHNEQEVSTEELNKAEEIIKRHLRNERKRSLEESESTNAAGYYGFLVGPCAKEFNPAAICKDGNEEVFRLLNIVIDSFHPEHHLRKMKKKKQRQLKIQE